MKSALTIFGIALATLTTAAYARDTVLQIPLADVLAMPEAQEKLDGSVKFFLDGQAKPKVLKTFGGEVANEKTNGTNKSDEFGCKWAALSALVRLQTLAKHQGANAVIGIVSYYKKEVVKSPTTFECHAGTFVVAVALKGDLAKIAN